LGGGNGGARGTIPKGRVKTETTMKKGKKNSVASPGGNPNPYSEGNVHKESGRLQRRGKKINWGHVLVEWAKKTFGKRTTFSFLDTESRSREKG